MSNRKLVSILIPCFNAAPFVRAALDSALSQTWPSKEVIVVDDGSTDGCRDLLDSYRRHGVVIIHESCGSASAARNRAFRESRGEFVKFFDADDLLDPRTIELQMQRVGDSDDAVATCEWGRFYNDDLSTFKLNPQSVWRDMEATDWLVESWLDARPMMQPGLFLIPRPLLERSGLWDETLSLIDDFEFLARVLCHSSEVRFAPGARLYYRSGIKGSLSGLKTPKAAASAFHSLTLGTGHVLKKRQDSAARRSCANVLQDFIYTFYPAHRDLRRKIAARVRELGGSDLAPDGSPRFKRLQRFVGWKAARLAQEFARRRMRTRPSVPIRPDSVSRLPRQMRPGV
jgi:glycosyltransferase involved in cell wall biosynthesis